MTATGDTGAAAVRVWVVCDLDGIVLDASADAEEVFRVTRRGLIGRSLYTFFDAERRAISTDILEFRGRVLVVQASRDWYGRAALISDTALPVHRATARSASSVPWFAPPAIVSSYAA